MMNIGKITAVAFCILLSACGVKPKNVSPPESATESVFPRTYPNLKTDPAPQP